MSVFLYTVRSHVKYEDVDWYVRAAHKALSKGNTALVEGSYYHDVLATSAFYVMSFLGRELPKKFDDRVVAAMTEHAYHGRMVACTAWKEERPWETMGRPRPSGLDKFVEFLDQHADDASRDEVVARTVADLWKHGGSR